MRRREKEIFSLIPVYPSGCSMELLALSAGYVKKPYTFQSLGDGVKELRKDLGWLTVREQTIVERVLPLQRSTVKKVRDISKLELKQKEATYISRYIKGGEKRKEK